MGPGEARPESGAMPDTGGLGRMVVCLDGSELGECILPHALAVARSLGGSLTLLRVVEGRTLAGAPPDPLAWEIHRRESQRYLERKAASSDADLPIETELIEGRAAEEICLWARQHDAALTVLCSHGTSGESDWGLASTARKLVERAPGSVLLVPAGAVAQGPVARYQRVLVPVDGSARAERAVQLAKRLADVQGAELILAHVVPVPQLTQTGPLDAEALELRERLARRNERVANDYLDRLRARLASGDGQVRCMALHGGDPRSRLEQLIAEEGVDFVVLSARGHTGGPELGLGSVAAYLAAHATTPLLIVRRASALSVRRVGQDWERVRPPSHATL